MPPRNFEIHFLWRIMPPQGRVPLVLGFRRVPPVWLLVSLTGNRASGILAFSQF